VSSSVALVVRFLGEVARPVTLAGESILHCLVGVVGKDISSSMSPQPRIDLEKTTARFREGVLDGASSCSRAFPFIADLVGDLLREGN